MRLFAKGDISFFLKLSLGDSKESEVSVVCLTSKIHTILPKNRSYSRICSGDSGPCCNLTMHPFGKRMSANRRLPSFSITISIQSSGTKVFHSACHSDSLSIHESHPREAR